MMQEESIGNARHSDKRVWCGIPAYNNAATIVDIAQRCRRELAHVIVVDDGSSDADLTELLRSLDVVVIRHPKNLGKGAALLTMFRYAAEQGGQYLVAIDGDGQHFPEDLPKFLERLEPATIIIGKREQVSGVMPKSSLFGREFSDFWVCVETGANLSDTQSGFRAYPLQHVLELPLVARHYNFEIEVITRWIWAGLNAASVPIRVWYPEAAERVSSFRPILDNLRLSWMHTKLVLRQLAPIPHRQIGDTPVLGKRSWIRENSTPLGLATAAGMSVLMSVVLWPVAVIAVLYVAVRLHLNKIVALACVALCMPIPRGFCERAGQLVLPRSSGGMQWFVGAHIVGVLLAVVIWMTVYCVARRWRIEHEHR
jgi:glycosyltransferase involved in cell wall biosynthesis